MSERPLITILTPVFNGEKYISETIDSVIRNKFKYEYEYIVLNDGSTDSTLDILNEFKNHIKILSHSNMGESLTVNRGIEVALGEFILVLNADDPLLSADLINMGCETLMKDPDLVAAYPDWKIIDEAGKTIKINTPPDFTDDVMVGESRCLPGPGTMFRKNAAMKIGGRRAKWKFVGDYDFWLRLSRVGLIKKMPGLLAQWRENQGSISISQRGLEMSNERLDVITNFIQENELDNKLKSKALGNSHYLAARLAFFDTRIEGRKLLLKSFYYKRGWPNNAKIYIVIYLLFLPISKKLLDMFPRMIRLISKR